jgi:hypothetical protein
MSLNSRESKERNPRCIGGGGIFVYTALRSVITRTVQPISATSESASCKFTVSKSTLRQLLILYAVETGTVRETADRIGESAHLSHLYNMPAYIPYS